MKINFNIQLVIFVMVVFFVISFITNIIGPLIPQFIKTYNLSLVLASFLPLSFFFSYGVFSIPAGIYLERYGGKTIMVFAFLISSVGAGLIIAFPGYMSFIISFFLIGTGMAILQVAINPLLRNVVSGENFAFFSIIGQLAFGSASFLSPIFYKFLLEENNPLGTIYFNDSPWIWIYVLFILAVIILLFFLYLLKIPKNDLDSEHFDIKIFFNFLKSRNAYFYFFGIFCYVGVEQGINNWSSEFLFQYHSLDPEVIGVEVISSFWGNLTIGTIISLFLVKIIDEKKLLNLYALSSSLLVLLAIHGDSEISVLSFKLLGFSISGVWSVMISLGLNSVPKNHSIFSGILLTGIVGGAIFPFIIAALGQVFDLKVGMHTILFGLLYLSYVGFTAKPLISNNKINLT
jgi:fucose permease|tara:strand:- start:2604 stop:3812 length:1209 start_codon:yes stop_codon:yes gene_type:complete